MADLLNHLANPDHAVDTEIDRREEAHHDKLVAQAEAKGWRRWFEPNYNVNYSARLFSSHYEDPWDKELQGHKQTRWMDNFGSRVAIRGVTRGILAAGAMSYTDYLVDKHFLPASSMSKAELAETSTINQVMNVGAKAYDVTFGAAIKGLFGENAVTFRPNRAFNAAHPEKMGRSFGEEAFAVTAGFWAASVPDSIGRDLAADLDPNVKKPYWQDGHFHLGGFLKAKGKSVWHAVSYSAMEDIAVAPVYVYQMAGSRWALGKMFPGAQLALEHGFNGGGHKIDRTGHVIGDFTLPAAIDLDVRFKMYNADTLMFWRDPYNHVKHLWKHRHDVEKPVHDRENDHGILKNALDYGLKSTEKAFLYMTPATPVFWAFRSSHGMMESPKIFHDEKTGEQGVAFSHPEGQPASRYGFHHRYLPESTRLTVGRTANENLFEITGDAAKKSYFNSAMKPFELEEHASLFAKAMRPFAVVSAQTGRVLGDIATRVKLGARPDAAVAVANDRYWSDRSAIHKEAQRFANNSLAYTPYMIAKYETANLMDTPSMDAALYRMNDGLMHLNFHEAKSGLQDVGNVIRRYPVSIETERMTHEPRGLINSTQQSKDADDIRDGHMVKSFAERQRENKIARLKARHGTATAEAESAQENPPSSKVSSNELRGRVANDNGTRLGAVS